LVISYCGIQLHVSTSNLNARQPPGAYGSKLEVNRHPEKGAPGKAQEYDRDADLTSRKTLNMPQIPFANHWTTATAKLFAPVCFVGRKAAGRFHSTRRERLTTVPGTDSVTFTVQTAADIQVTR
jgi:hypothetical protein